MKLRLFPILITVAVTAAVLFGGWFGYERVAVAKPLNHSISSLPGVKQGDMHMTRTDVQIDLTLDNHADLREIYRKLKSEDRSLIGSRHIQIHIQNPSSKALDDIWSSSLFQVAQAMATRHYADIPHNLKQTAAEHPGLRTLTEMDADNVYVRLTLKGVSKYIILPRKDGTGVWSGE